MVHSLYQRDAFNAQYEDDYEDEDNEDVAVPASYSVFKVMFL